MRILLLVLIGFGFACQQANRPVVGKYRSVSTGLLKERYEYIFKNSVRIIGSELDIRQDSTFRYQTCANLMTGKWHLRSDSLFLMMQINRWRIDSLHEHGWKGTHPKPGGEARFVIKGDRLIEYGKATFRGKSWNAIEELEQADD